MKKAFILLVSLFVLNIATSHAQIITHTETALTYNYYYNPDSVDIDQDGVYDVKLEYYGYFDDATFSVHYNNNNYLIGALADSGATFGPNLDTFRFVALDYIACTWLDGAWQPNTGYKYSQFARVNAVNDTTFGWLKLNFTGFNYSSGGCSDTLACVEVAYSTIPNVHLRAGQTVFPCGQVTGITYSYPDSTTAVVSWNSSASGQYEYVIDQSPAVPAGSGTPSTDTFVIVPGLVQGTVYYAHVRVNCSGDYSAWITIAFTAPAPCNVIPVIQVTGITSSTASFQWPTSTSNSVEYAIDQSAGDPVTGTAIPGNSVTTTGLDCNTAYYFHLRRVCLGEPSAWVETQVHTDTCLVLGVPALNSSTKIFPNPASNELTITADNNEYNRCTIINMVGKTVFAVPLTQATTRTDIRALVPGVYYVTLHGKNGVKMMRFVKM